MSAVLDVVDLRVSFRTWRGDVEALKGVSLSLQQGETMALVGESGSGKSVTAMSAIGLLDRSARVTGGKVLFQGRDLLQMTRPELRQMRGASMSMIFQNPRAALNPVRSILLQIMDALTSHSKMSQAATHDKALGLLRAVAFRDPERVGACYPHQLSGGMCQRALIAIAISCDPVLLIADEPTTGLDVTTQKQIMDLLGTLIRENGMSMLLITHDLGIAAQYSDRISVMYHGEIIETGMASSIGETAVQPYTKRLIAASPTRSSRVEDLLDADDAPPAPAPRYVVVEAAEPVLRVSNLGKTFDKFDAVKGVSFAIHAGTSLGLVGESGSGKSTISRLVCQLVKPDRGTIFLNGEPILAAGSFGQDQFRRRVQLVLQDPIESINPRFTAFRAISDPLIRLMGISNRSELEERVMELADMVGLQHSLLSRLPHQLSGGQAARVGMARAIATAPQLLVLDEPTAALDVSIQAIVLNLLEKLRCETGTSYLFVSHDLNVVRMMCESIIVLREGAIVDRLTSDNLFSPDNHEYTRKLASAILEAPPRRHGYAAAAHKIPDTTGNSGSAR